MKSNKTASRCTQRTLEHSDGTPRGTSRAMQEQLGTQGNQSLEGTWSLGHSRHLGTRRTIRYSGTRPLGHSKDTWGLKALESTSFSRLDYDADNHTLFQELTALNF